MTSSENIDEQKTGGPLAGLRVVEMGTLIAGPFCGQLLGDLGAEVLKVEAPGAGDPMRNWGQVKRNGQSYWWSVIGRNKKSITLNLREKEGQEIARDLIKTADILVENFRPGTMEKWGLGYDVLSADNPRLIMARISGYGQDGPYSRRAGFGLIGEAMGGLRHVTGYPDRPPTRIGISIGDSLTATFAALGCLAALRSRDITGRGQIVDSALYESVLAMMESLVPEYCGEGHQRDRSGAILPKIAPSNVYPCANGDSILIAANQDTVFARLCELMDRNEFLDDPRFCDHVARGENQELIDDIISKWSEPQAAEDLLQALDEAGVPAGKIFQVKDMIDDPQFLSRKALIDVETPGLGKVKMQNVVPKLSDTPGQVRSPAPELGQHTQSILEDYLNLSSEQIDVLRTRKIV
ncbi:CoA transferase [uncultured Parasphingorhabdus sp.]|uniref:CaiB/BaiF CoA transferase family protein n=1 Tax=uncultured Parasphingorhabdus sp. TaxID=2709694 RepID=UPI002AA7D131|nr:CoA transferase [uncultured Parasphingorhabdus sp.]